MEGLLRGWCTKKDTFYGEWFNDWSALEEYCIVDIKDLQDLAGDQDAWKRAMNELFQS